MSMSIILHLLGSGLVLLLVRLGGGPTDVLFQAQALGWLLILLALVGSVRSSTELDGSAATKRWVVGGQILGALALVGVLALNLDKLDALGMSDEGRVRAEVLLTSLNALALLVSWSVLLCVGHVRAASPVMLPARRVAEAAYVGLSIAFGLALLFPVNYLASEHNVRWDHSYFKTATPGDVTRATIDNLDAPVQAWLFFPPTSDVTEEVRTYFDQLEGSNLEIAYVDQALETALAKDLRVQKNGTIALVRGSGDDKQVQRIRLGDDLSKAERKLKKLDEEVSKALLKIAADPKQAYVTVGHGEMYWKKSGGVLPARTIEGVKAELKRLNFKVSELGAVQGLATEVPEDAELVIIMGPTEPFLPEELQALDEYRQKGGALWVAMDPGSGADLGGLLAPVGLAYAGDQMLVGDNNYWAVTRRITDRYNIFTNKASTHRSVTTLSRNSKTSALLTPLAAPLTQLPNPPFKVEITVRTLSEVWVDAVPNLRLDEPVEQRKGWPISAAISGIEPAEEGIENTEFRMLVTGDATWASDLVLPVSKGNQEFLRDGVAWLVDQPSQGGTVNDEEDVKIRHTKSDEAWMFYGSTLLIPVLFLWFGLARVRSRTRSNGGVA